MYVYHHPSKCNNVLEGFSAVKKVRIDWWFWYMGLVGLYGSIAGGELNFKTIALTILSVFIMCVLTTL